MKTAVDSSILLDVLGVDICFGDWSREALRTAYNTGALVACEIVWAEVRAHCVTDAEFDEVLDLLGLRFEALSPDVAALAGRLWRESRVARQLSRNRVAVRVRLADVRRVSWVGGRK